MHGFAQNMEIEGLTGSDLIQICVGKFDVQFRFGSGTLIAVQGGARVLNNGTQIASWSEENSWDSPAFHKLLNQSATKYSVSNENVFRIDFEEGLVLELIDNSEQYESMQIYPNGDLDKIIVV